MAVGMKGPDMFSGAQEDKTKENREDGTLR